MRLCACPCKRSLEGKRKSAKYYSAKRNRAWMERRGYVAIRYVKASHDGNSSSGLQVSYRKAVDALQSHLGIPRHSAEEALRLALPVRQRLRLEQRSKEAANG